MSKPTRTRSFENYAAKFPALAKRRPTPPPAARVHDFTQVLLGHDYLTGAPVFVDETVRLEHALTVGATGSGKTVAEKNIMLQILRTRGGIVLDPHGSHPDSLFHHLIVELERDGFFESRRIHILNPNDRDFTVPINFLAGFEDTDFSTLADCLLEAVEKVWGGENTHEKPTLRSVIKMTFAALAELRLALTDAKLFYDPHDHAGFRARVITMLKNEYARDELERLHATSLERNKHDFRAEIVGPINRLNEFLSSETVRAMLGVVDEPGMPRRTLDLLEIMNQGEILLCNLQDGPGFSKADATLFGSLLLRYIFLLASRRTNTEPFTLCVDEAARFLTGDGISDILAETRKFGIAARFNLQFMAQAGKPGDVVYEALLNSTAIKTIFQLRSPKEAQMFAEYQIGLNLERPVAASIRPTVIGHRRVNLASSGTSTQEANTEGEAETVAEMHALTTMQSRGTAIATTTMESSGAGEFSGVGDSAGMVMSPQATLLGPNGDGATSFPVALSQSTGQNVSRGSSQQSSSSSGTTETSIYTEGEAETHARSRATTQSRARTRGHGTTAGLHEAFEPVYADLPTSFHSKDNELYRAGELLLNLPVGRAFVSFRGKRFCISVPPPKKRTSP